MAHVDASEGSPLMRMGHTGHRSPPTNAGVDSIEHGTFLDEAGARAMKAHGTYYSATC